MNEVALKSNQGYFHKTDTRRKEGRERVQEESYGGGDEGSEEERMEGGNLGEFPSVSTIRARNERLPEETRNTSASILIPSRRKSIRTVIGSSALLVCACLYLHFLCLHLWHWKASVSACCSAAENDLKRFSSLILLSAALRSSEAMSYEFG
jgi:hypothetical protein